jgi:hypothetical protein
LRVQDYESAIQLLYIGGELLLENGLSASGADITVTLIEVYNTAHMKPDSTNRGNLPVCRKKELIIVARIVQLLGMIGAEEPNRQRIIHDAVEYALKTSFNEVIFVDGRRRRALCRMVIRNFIIQ